MISKKELLSSVVVRRLIEKRLEGLGSAMAYRQQYGHLPPVDKEGSVTGPNDNGCLFIRLGLVFEAAGKKRIRPTKVRHFNEKNIDEIVEHAIRGEKATLLGKRGYAYKVLLSNEFFPTAALQIVRALHNDGKLKVTLGEEIELSEEHIVTSYLPPILPGEEIKYSSRTEMASYLAVCGSFIGHYHNLAEPHLKFLSSEGFKKYLHGSREYISDSRGRVLVPTSIVHAHNSRMIERSITGPITYLGKSKSFGEFAMITYEEGHNVLEEMVNFGKKRTKLSPVEIIARDDNAEYVCVVRIYPKTTPGRRSTKSNIMLLRPESDLGLKPKTVDNYVQIGYNQELKEGG